MQESNGGLGTLLNEVTQESGTQEEKIVYIDIDKLESNPKNFYGLRDVDTLAGLITVSHLVEPLTVSAKADGKYTKYLGIVAERQCKNCWMTEFITNVIFRVLSKRELR